MISFVIALLAAPVFNDVIFNDGDVHHLTEADVSPSDNIIVLPLSGFNGTVVSLLQQAVVQSLTAGNLCITQVAGDARVLQDVTVQSGGRVLISSAATIEGDLHIESGGEGNFFMGTIEGNVTVDAGSELVLQDLVLGDVNVQGECFIRGVVEGAVFASGNAVLVPAPGDLRGPVLVEGAAELRVFPSRFEDSVTVGGNARGAILGSTTGASTELLGQFTIRDSASVIATASMTVSLPIRVEDSATLTIFALTANVPFGEVAGSSGVLTGFAAPGVPYSLAFSKTAGATIILQSTEPTFGVEFCGQPDENSTGSVASITATGSRIAEERNLVLTSADVPPQTFGYFFAGTSIVPILFNGGRICVGGNIGRYVGPGQILNSGPMGVLSLNAPTDPIPGNPGATAVAGDTFYFQAWFRDVDAAAGVISRVSRALAITFI